MKALLIVLAVIAVVAVGFVVFPHDMAAIEVKAEPIGLGKHLTNAVVTSFVLSAALAVFAFFFGRRLKERPGGLQNVVEGLIEGLDNLVRDVAPKRWAETFFPIVATIFLYLLVVNMFSLLTPFLGAVRACALDVQGRRRSRCHGVRRHPERAAHRRRVRRPEAAAPWRTPRWARRPGGDRPVPARSLFRPQHDLGAGADHGDPDPVVRAARARRALPGPTSCPWAACAARASPPGRSSCSSACWRGSASSRGSSPSPSGCSATCLPARWY